MTGFSRLAVQGFRRLSNIDIELRPLCVLIGANGSGKTSLLDVFSTLAASANGKLGEQLSSMGGINSVISANRTERLSFETEFALEDGQQFKYRLVLKPLNIGHEIENELLIHDGIDESSGRKVSQSRFHVSNGGMNYSTSNSQLIEVLKNNHRDRFETTLFRCQKIDPEADLFRDKLAASLHFRSFSTDPRSAVRLPQPLRPTLLPGSDGEDLVSCLFTMRETSRDRFEAVEDSLRSVFPGFERLDFPPVAAGTLAVTWKDKNLTRPMYMNELSEGTLRFLWLVALLQSPELPAITMIDEPEVSLHPELLALLADLMREATARTQLVVATHADRLVRFLEPHEVMTMNLNEDGTSSVAWADTLELGEWLSEYTLDEVWRLGRMGARA